MTVALPWQARVSARFALPRNRHPERDWQINYSPMRDDVFDVEVEGIFERSSNFDNLHLDLSNVTANGVTLMSRSVDIAHNFRDVWGVRVGGDVNILPDRLAVRAGFSYETGAQTTQQANLDLASYDTFGLHLGASYRFHFGSHYSLTASLAYAHFFMADQTSTDGTQMTMGATGNTTQTLCDAPTGPGPGACNINRGTYSASVDTLSAGLSLRL
jgi:long-chain fatty acid transport protein